MKKLKGAGDLAKLVFIKMGIAPVVKKIAGEDCGCEKRQETLNKLIPFK